MDATIWSRVQQEIARRHRFARVLEKEVQLALIFSHVRVVVCVCPVSPSEVVLLAEVGHVSAVEPVTALRLNNTLAEGALALVGHTYAVRLRTKELDGDELERRLQAIAAVAAAVKLSLRRDVDGTMFQNYVE